MAKLRVGIIGLGIGEAHIVGFRAHSGCEVTTLCDFSPEKLREVGSRYPGLKLVQDASAILQNPEIDVISIASYENYHHEQIMGALRNGKHVFVEKPMCQHPWQLKEIRDALTAQPKLRLSSNLILRKSPRFLHLRERIRGGEFGDIFCMEGSYNYGRVHKIHDGWRGKLDEYSAVLGGGLHIIDLMLWMTGDRVTEVSAFGTGIASRGTQYRFDDTVIAVLKFASGMVGKVSTNFPLVGPHFHEFSVFGTKATFVNGLPNARMYLSRDPAVTPVEINDPYPGLEKGDLIPGFISSIVSGSAPEISPDEIFRGLEVGFGIDRAVRENAVVRLSE